MDHLCGELKLYYGMLRKNTFLANIIANIIKNIGNVLVSKTTPHLAVITYSNLK